MIIPLYPMEFEDPMRNMVIEKEYLVNQLIGVGSFSKVYSGIRVKDKKKVAIKLEPSKQEFPLLFKEFRILEYLEKKSIKSGVDPCFPKAFLRTTNKQYNVLVMEFFGQNLESCKKDYENKKLPLEYALQITLQLLNHVQFLHEAKFIHRDIKPENFVLGTEENKDKLFMIDFGISKQYMRQGKHIEYKEDKSLTGTARYASINNHQGVEISRRDDLEALGYMFIYLLRGSLPWQNSDINDKTNKFEYILQKKIQTPILELCKDMPIQYAKFLNYVRNLQFYDDPDYQFMKNLFLDLQSQLKSMPEEQLLSFQNEQKKKQESQMESRGNQVTETTQQVTLQLDSKYVNTEHHEIQEYCHYDPKKSCRSNSMMFTPKYDQFKMSKLDESIDMGK